MPMNILQLSPRFPYPLIDGGAVGVFKITECVAALGHKITFATYPDPEINITEAAKIAMSAFCDLQLTPTPLPSMKSVLLRTIFRGAYPIERRMMPEMFELIERLMSENMFDIVHIDHAHMGKYGLWIKERYKIPVVLREHNYETLIYERFAANAKNSFKKIVASVHAKRLRAEEARFIQGVDAVIPITLKDEALMRKDSPDAVYYTIPAGVDIDYYKPQPELETENNILWIGGVNWLPNRDAVEFFVKEIFPLVVKAFPKVTFDIVGDSTDTLQPLAQQWADKIRLHGRVPDIRPFVGQATVLVCPLRVGGGMRLKLLDFFASGKAVVSTHIGAEGNLARDGEEFLLRDDAVSFANAVIELLRNPELRYQLDTNARSLALREYSWESVGKRFCDVYEKVISQRNDDNQHIDHSTR